MLHPDTPPKTSGQDSTPQMPVSLSALLHVSVGCLSLHFLEVLSPELPP